MPAIAFLDLSAPSRPGLVPCALCGQLVHADRPTVHFATPAATRPCVASWPAPAKKRARA